MGDLDDFGGGGCRHYHRAVIIADDRIAGAHQYAAALDAVIDLPGPELSRPLFGSSVGGSRRESRTL